MLHQLNRRGFAKQASMLAAAVTLPNTSISLPKKACLLTQDSKFVPNRIAISTYSFWRYRNDSKFSIPRCVDMAAEMGFDGVEILKVQMEDDSPGYLQQLKQRAFSNGLDLCGMSTHQGFVSPDADERKKNVDATIGFIEMAYALGIPTIRVNTGRWRTIKSFDQLMANKGIEPNLEGYSDDQGFQWVIDALTECLPTAEKCGVVMGLENHWGLGRTAEGVLRIIRALIHPGCGPPWILEISSSGENNNWK